MRSGIKLIVLCTALLFTSQLAAQDATARLERLRQELDSLARARRRAATEAEADEKLAALKRRMEK